MSYRETDIFGGDVLHIEQDAGHRYGDFRYIAHRPYEGVHPLDAKGHFCDRLCPKHGDLALWKEMRDVT